MLWLYLCSYAVCRDREEDKAQLCESELKVTDVIYTTSQWLETKNFLTVTIYFCLLTFPCRWHCSQPGRKEVAKGGCMCEESC